MRKIAKSIMSSLFILNCGALVYDKMIARQKPRPIRTPYHITSIPKAVKAIGFGAFILIPLSYGFDKTVFIENIFVGTVFAETNSD